MSTIFACALTFFVQEKDLLLIFSLCLAVLYRFSEFYTYYSSPKPQYGKP